MSEEKLKEAKKLVVEEEAKNREACNNEIEEVLKKYGYALQITTPKIVFVNTGE